MGATELLLSLDASFRGYAVHLCNAYTLSLAFRDPELGRVLNSDQYNFPDGMPLVWIARSLGFRHVTSRVYGPDLMLSTFSAGMSRGMRHYLHGSTPTTTRSLLAALATRFPGANIVGYDCPPFRPMTEHEEARLIDRLIALHPHFVWVGLGTPKQDLFIHRMAMQVPSTFVAVGAAFDFISGTKPQAPEWMRENGLEWAYRLSTEPRRLAPRYLAGNFQFLAALLTEPPTPLFDGP